TFGPILSHRLASSRLRPSNRTSTPWNNTFIPSITSLLPSARYNRHRLVNSVAQTADLTADRASKLQPDAAVAPDGAAGDTPLERTYAQRDTVDVQEVAKNTPTRTDHGIIPSSQGGIDSSIYQPKRLIRIC